MNTEPIKNSIPNLNTELYKFQYIMNVIDKGYIKSTQDIDELMNKSFDEILDIELNKLRENIKKSLQDDEE